MPTKDEISERLHDAIEDHDDGVEGIVEEIFEEEATPEVDEEPSVNGEPRSSSREYVVLINAGKDAWSQVKAPIEATSAEAAIRSLGEELQDGSTYVAVPKRNWNPVPVTIKTTTTISFA